MRWSLTYTASFFLWHETWSHCLIAPKGTTYSIGVSTMVTTVIPAKVPSIFLSTAVRYSATLRKILLSVTWASLASKILGNVQQQWRSTVSECQWEIVTGELPYDLADASGRVMIERQEWSPRHEPLSSLVALANVVETFNFDSFNVMHALELLFRRVEALSERSIIFGWVASLVRHRHRPQGSPGFHCHGPKILILLCHLGLKSKGLRILVVRTPREKKKSILPHFWSLSLCAELLIHALHHPSPISAHWAVSFYHKLPVRDLQEKNMWPKNNHNDNNQRQTRCQFKVTVSHSHHLWMCRANSRASSLHWETLVCIADGSWRRLKIINNKKE